MNPNPPQQARDLFNNGGFYCAESVLLAIAKSQGIHSDLLPKIATGFCSGIARTGGQCGAISGAIMGLGLLTGRNEPFAPVEAHYFRVQAFLRLFEDKFGSITCQGLTGCHLSTAEGQIHFKETEQINNCLSYVETATQMAIDLINS